MLNSQSPEVTMRDWVSTARIGTHSRGSGKGGKTDAAQADSDSGGARRGSGGHTASPACTAATGSTSHGDAGRRLARLGSGPLALTKTRRDSGTAAARRASTELVLSQHKVQVALPSARDRAVEPQEGAAEPAGRPEARRKEVRLSPVGDHRRVSLLVRPRKRRFRQRESGARAADIRETRRPAKVGGAIGLCKTAVY